MYHESDSDGRFSASKFAGVTVSYVTGKEQASQALARIGITIDPARAFPGERAYEVVRPLLNLLEVEKTALQNFEALLALTNLAQMGESVR